MRIPLLRLAYDEEDIAFIREGIVEVLRSGFLTMGDKVRTFERLFADFIGVQHAVAVNSGTSALEIALRTKGVTGKTVLVPDITYMATPISVVHAGGKVRFVDVMPENLSMDPDDLLWKIDGNVAGVIPVHIGGIISPYFWEIKKICDEHGLFIVEDAAHAHGSCIDGKKAGTLGLSGAFSFYPTKVMNTAEGGMVTTNDEEIYDMAIVLREHGKRDHRFNVHTEFGYNWRFSELHALLGIQQMRKLDQILSDRIRIAHWYDSKLKDFEKITLVHIPENIVCTYYKYIVYLAPQFDRDRVKQTMREQYQVYLTGEVYADPCHSQPVFQKYPETLADLCPGGFPGSDYVSSRQICLPLYPGLTEAEVEYVVESLAQVLGE